MPIQIQAPDGSIAEFPDGTPDATITSVMAKTYGGPSAAAAPKRSLMDNVSGVMANVNRGLGIGDELAAGFGTGLDVLTGKSGPNVVQTYRDELAKQRQLEDGYTDAHPNVAALARGTGNALTLAAPLGPGAEAFATGGKAINALRGATVAGLGGAGYAAVDRGTPEERLAAASAASHDPLTLALGGGAGALAAVRPRAAVPQADTPSLESLTAQKNAAYKAVDDSGVRYSPEAFDGLMRDMAQAMDEHGFSSGSHRAADAKMKAIGESQRALGGYSPTLSQLDDLRFQIGRDVASSPEAGERAMGTIMRNKIDDFVARADPADLVGGDATTAAPMITRARDLNTRVQKLRSLDNLDDLASRRAARTGSGGNKENALRQNVDRFISDTGNLTPQEDAAARAVVNGSPTGNVLRQLGKLSPAGNGLGLAVHAVGAVTSHGATLPLAAGGFASKLASEAITSRNVQALRNLIAQGGETAAQTAKMVDAAAETDPMVRELQAQLANDMVVQGGVQGADARSRRGSVTAEIEGHPEYGVAVSQR